MNNNKEKNVVQEKMSLNHKEDKKYTLFNLIYVENLGHPMNFSANPQTLFIYE